MAVTTPRGLQDSVTNVYEDARESVETLKADVQAAGKEASRQVERELSRARKTANRLARSAASTARENPLATAGVLLGTGALLGVILQRVMNPPPTPREIVFEALRRRGIQTGAAIVTGYQLARRAMRR